VVEDGVQGIIIQPGDIDALAAAIQHLYDHPEIVERMERLRERFEGREAIYADKGLLRVRVCDITPRPGRSSVAFQVEEIRTPGLGVGAFHQLRSLPQPLRARLSAGWQSHFTATRWYTGMFGGTLYFSTEAIQQVVARAAQWAHETDVQECYGRVSEALPRAQESPAEDLFPDQERQRRTILESPPATVHAPAATTSILGHPRRGPSTKPKRWRSTRRCRDITCRSPWHRN